MQQQQPVFSIIIPTYARPDRLAVCLQAITHLQYPRECFEVLAVDDGSQAPPEALVTSFARQCNLTLLTQPHAGPATARNTGAARAKGAYLAFTDDDCTPAPDWLQTLAVRFAATPDCAIGGRTLNALSHNLYSAASQLLIDYLYSYYNANANGAHFFASNNLAMPAAHFRAIGGFDTTFPLAAGEDRELCDRWLHHGYRMIYAPEVLVHHCHDLTLRTFCKQHFNYGRGAFYFRQMRAQRGLAPIRLEPLAFYLDLLRYPFSRAQGQQALLLAALLVLSQGANAGGFWREKTMHHERKRQTPS
jgi:GT2 family glycosyltransferase